MLPITSDLPPTGTDQVEYFFQHSFEPEAKGELFVFNTIEYFQTESFSMDIAHQDVLRQFQRRYDQLMLLFKRRWEQSQAAFSDISHKEVLKRSGSLAVFILLTSPEKVSVDVTSEATVFFTAIYMNVNAYIEAHFAPDEETEIVFNIYQNGGPVLAYGGEFDLAVNQYIHFFAEK